MSSIFSGVGSLLALSGIASVALIGGVLGALAILVDVSTVSFSSDLQRSAVGRAQMLAVAKLTWNGNPIADLLGLSAATAAVIEAVNSADRAGHLNRIPRHPPGSADFSDQSHYWEVMGALVNECGLSIAMSDALIAPRVNAGPRVDRGEGS